MVTGTVIDQESVFQTIPRTTLTSEEISARQPATVADLLRGVAGVDVTQQGGAGGLTFVALRGGDPNFTVVMIDGVKVDDPTNSQGGGFDFTGLDPLLIERIDVYFGSYSAVYGSDSLGGAISVITKNPHSSLGGSADLEVGTDDARAGALQVTGPLGGAANVSIAAVSREGEEAVEGASLSRQQVVVKLRSAQGESGPEWGASFFGTSGAAEYFPIASGGDRLAVVRAREHKDFQQYAARGTLDWSPASAWQTRLAGGWSRYEAQIDSPAIAPGILSGVPATSTDNDFERLNVVVSSTIILPGLPLLGFGAEYVREDGSIDSVIDVGFPLRASFEQQRDIRAVFGEAAFKVSERFGVIATVRHDAGERISSTNGRIAATANVTDTGTSASLIYAEGFKLPSLFALGHPLTGNPDLEPETSRNYELELHQSLFAGRAGVAVTLYRNHFEDLVDFDADLFRHVNRDSVTAKGMDLSLTAAINDRLRITGNVGYLDADVSGGTRLEGRPRWKAGVTLSWQPAEDWLVGVYGKINGAFYDTAVPTGTVLLDGYTRIDASVRWDMTDTIDVSLLLTNAFDHAYEEAVGFSNAGRQIRLAVGARL